MPEHQMAFESEPRDTARYLAAVREHWVLVLVVLAVAVATATAYSVTRADEYEAEADVLVTPVSPDDEILSGLGLLRDPAGSVFTAGRLLETPQVTGAVSERLGLDESRRELLARITVTPLQQSNLVSIVARDSTARGAASVANAFADELIAERTRVFRARLDRALRRLRGRREDLRPDPGTPEAALAADLDERLAYLNSYVGARDPTLEIWNRATAADAPTPKSPLGVVAAFAAALVLGTGIALLLDLTSTRIRREDELRSWTPVLARVPRLGRRKVSNYLAGRAAFPADAWEPYRTLRARLSSSAGGPPRTVLVTSAVEGDGKTVTASNLAITLAAGRRNVVLVDANFRTPGVAKVFGVEPNDVGLVGLLEDGPDAVESAVQPAGPQAPNLRLLLPGPDAGDAVDLLDAQRVAGIVAAVAERYDLVVIDSPPLTEFGDAIALASAADAVLLAVRLGHSRAAELAEAERIMSRQGIVVAGFVVTERRWRRRKRARGRIPVASELAARDDTLAPTP